ncbi:MAG: hypothetical protein WA102_09115 [Candidatus Methanoperedens sp.]
MKRQTAKDFLISTIFPTVLIPIFTVVVIVVNLINPQNPIPPIVVAIILVVLIVWAIIRWSLERNLSLIKRYDLLMKPLGELSRMNSNGNRIFLEVKEVIKDPPKNVNLSLCCEKYSELKLKQRDVNRKFNELNEKLDKLISIPYRLYWTDTVLIEKEFAELFSDTKTLHEDFIATMNCGNISEYLFDCDVLIAAYKDFFSALNAFIEIKNKIPKDILSPPPLPPHNPWKV